MAGRMAPYFAVGEHLVEFRKARAEVESELLSTMCAHLSDEQKDIIKLNFDAAVVQLEYVVKLKTAC